MTALSAKQRVFLEEYLQCWNASEAARRAGYRGRANTVGPRLLANVGISEAIKARLADLQMGTDEFKVRLTEQARNVGAAFFLDDGSFDFEACIAAGKMHLIKSVTTTSGEKSSSQRVELLDPQAALIHIGKYHKLFSDSDTTIALNLVGLDDLMARIYGPKADEGSKQDEP